MKHLSTLLLLILMPVFLMAQEKGEVTVPLSNPDQIGMLVVDVRQGMVTIKGTSRKDVLVAYEEVQNKDDDKDHDDEDGNTSGLKKIATSQLDLSIEENDNTVRINSDSWGGGANLVIEVPAQFNLQIDSYMGKEISVDNVSGEIVLDGYVGSIFAKNVSGSVNASTYAGKIEVQITSIAGNEPMAFSTYAGTIDLSLPSTTAADLKMKTKWGSIFTGFDMDVRTGGTGLKKEESDKGFKLSTDTWTYGKINGGGPEIMIKSTAGSIYVKKV